MWPGPREQVAFAANKVGGAGRGLRLSTGVTVREDAPLNRGGLDRKGEYLWGRSGGLVPVRSWK